MLSISTARVSAEEIARHSFGTIRRGFDPGEVRSFLETVARELHAVQQRETELLDALAAAEHRAANPVLDESTLTTALGQETAKVLRSAHDAAAELVARAENDVARLRAQAEDESDQIRGRAEQLAAERGAQVEATATEVRRRIQEEEQSRLEAAKLEAEALVSQARAECRAMVQEAQELRARVLSDLTRRRRVLHTQIEQLRAGRERLAQTIGNVRHAVDRVTDDLFRAEDEARLAAEAAGRQVAAHDVVDDVAGRPPGAGPGEPLTPGASEVSDVADKTSLAAATVPRTTAGAQGAPAPSAPVGEAAPGADEEDTDLDEERRQQAVEDLFARLRAERVHEPTEHVTVIGPAPADPTPAVVVAQTAGEAEAAGEDDSAGETMGNAAAQDADVAEEHPADKDPAIGRRDELLSPALSILSRRLKRVLADDQNDILDRLRGHGKFDPQLLGSQEEHERRYREAAEAPLAQAAEAGAKFAGGSVDAVTTGSLAHELATSIVVPLRRRLVDQALPADEGDEAAIFDHVGAAFREWKGQRVERVAADHAHGAFWKAALDATDDHQQLHWIVDDDGAQCPDCDDNALAGSLPAGEPFPTGHLHPPAHPGCRCLLVPGPA